MTITKATIVSSTNKITSKLKTKDFYRIEGYK